MADSVIVGFDDPLKGYNSLCGGAAWGCDLQLSDSLYAHGHTGLTYGGAVFSFSSLSSGNTIGVYYHTEIVDGKEISTPYPVKLGGSLALTGSSYSFVKNSARWGGAIHAGDILFAGCSSVLFDSNKAIDDVYGSGLGGAINSTGIVLFEGCDNISFVNNSAIGGAVAKASSLCFEDCANVSITNNSANSGVITGDLHIKGCSGSVEIRNNKTTSSSGGGGVLMGTLVCTDNKGKIIFEDNYSAYMGGVVYTSAKNGTHQLVGNADVLFRNNSSEKWGGVFSVYEAISISDNEKVVFENNRTSILGGAIEIGGGYGLTVSGNGLISFIGNAAMPDTADEVRGQGGAISVTTAVFNDNATVLFQNNKAGQHGGAIIGQNVDFNGNESVSFIGNVAVKRGGAIHSDNFSFSGNKTVSFVSNSAEIGGAIWMDSNYGIIENNGIVEFIGNTATKGGAIYMPHNTPDELTLTGNTNLKFEGNIADAGAAIYAHDGVITISDNSRVQFIGNVSTSGASAIQANDSSGAPVLNIVDNGVVVFMNNVQNDGSSYAVNAEDLTISGNDYVRFYGNIKGLSTNKAVFDTKQGVADSCIEFSDDFYINSKYNYKNDPTAFNPTGDGRIVLSEDAKGDVLYDAILGCGSMEWEDRAQLTIGGNYTVGCQNKGASLVFNQSARRYNLKSLTVNGNLILQNGSDITFKLDQATEMSAPQGFVFVDDFLILDKSVNITVAAPPKVVQDTTLWSLVSVGRGVEYDGVRYVYRENVGWEYSDELGTHTRDTINDLFSWTFSDAKHSLSWIDNTLFYYAGNKARSLYKVARLYSDRTWRGDVFDYYDINKKKVTESKEASTSYGDSLLCWMVAGCNIIEYWQDKYAPLYQADFLVSNTDSSSHSSPIFAYYKKISGVVDQGSYFETAMYPWFLNKKSQNDRIAISKHDYSPWVNSFGFSEENFITLRVKNIDSMSDFFSNLKLVFNLSDSAIFLHYGEYKDNERIGGHVLTLWGAEIFPEKDICYIHVTDSDSEQDSMLRLKVKYDKNNKVACISNKEDLRIERLCYMTTPEGMDEMLEDFYSGKNDLEWTGRGVAWAAKIDGTIRLANVKDGFKIACSGAGKTVYAHKYFTNDERANFVFGDAVGGEAVTNKTVAVDGNISIGTATVKAKDYVFTGKTAGTGNLTAQNLTVERGAGLTIRQLNVKTDVLNVNGNLCVWDGDSSTRLEAGRVELGWNASLICGSLTLQRSDVMSEGCVQLGSSYYNVASGLCELSAKQVSGNGTLVCYLDFGGVEVPVSENQLNQSDSLNKAFMSLLTSDGKLSSVYNYNFDYISTNLTYRLDASETYDFGIQLNNSVLAFTLTEDGESLDRTLGSHTIGSESDIVADISISETLGGRVDAPDTALSTVSGAEVRLGNNSTITAASLTITEGSSLHNDGVIAFGADSGILTVGRGSVLSGSGSFGNTVVGEGGELRAGSAAGGALYSGLTLESGSSLVLSAEAMSNPMSRAASGVSLTLTGDLSLAEGVAVKVACGLDFLNNCALGETLTLKAIQLGGEPDADLMERLSGATGFVFCEEDGTLSDMASVGAYVHHINWLTGADNTLQLSFVLSAMPENALLWNPAGGDGVWNATAKNWKNSEGAQVAFTESSNVLICDGATIALEGKVAPGALVISTPEDVRIEGNGSLTGSGSVVKDGSGALYLATDNSEFIGSVDLNGGATYLEVDGALGSAYVTLRNAALHLQGKQVSSGVIVDGQSLLSGAENLTHLGVLENATVTVEGGYTVSEGVSFGAEAGASYIGDLTLDGGMISLGGLLTLEGNLIFTEGSVTTLDMMDLVADRYGCYELLKVVGEVQGFSEGALTLQNAEGSSLRYDAESGLIVVDFAPDLTWLGGKKAVWQVGAAGWSDNGVYEDGKTILFNGKGTVTIVGDVAPGNMTVDIAKSLTLKQDKKQGGSISGTAVLTKYGAGNLTLSSENTGWQGSVYVHEGTVTAGAATALGESRVILRGGALNLNNKSVGNSIELDGDAKITKGGKFCGDLMMMDGSLLKGSQLSIAAGHTATLYGGVVSGKLSGSGSVVVAGDVELDGGSISCNKLKLEENAVIYANQHLTMNSKASAIVLQPGAELTVEGKTAAYSLEMEGSTLNLGGALTLRADLIADGHAAESSEINLGASLSAQSMDLADTVLTQTGKKSKIALKGDASLFIAELSTESSMSVGGTLHMRSSVIDIVNEKSAGALTLSAKNAAHEVWNSQIHVAGKMSVAGSLFLDDSELSTKGTVSAAALTATDSVISIAAQEGMAAQSMKLTRKDVTKGVPQDNILTDSSVYVNGSMSVAGNLLMQNSDIYLRDYSGKNKAKGLSVKGDLTVGSGSLLSLTGALSAKNLTLEAGSSLTLGSAKLSTVKVGGALTLNGVVNFDLGFTVTEKDVAKGKEYTLFSFKSLVGDISNLTLGYEGEYTLALNTKETAIILTVSDAAAWNAYVADVQEALKKDEPMAEDEADDSAVAAAEEAVEAEDLLLKPVAAAADVDPLLAKVADTLVQSTWGTVGASRAFGETIASRGRHATLLDDGKGAAWLSVMGGSSSISSAEGHNGADFTLSGAAFGVESCVGEKSTLGVAIGNSWGKVSTFSAFPVDQDSMHVGIYGNHTLTKSLTLSWMATHTRTESEATILGAPYSWSQDALQLDARLTWGKSISDKTAVSAFAGLQYLATDSGECAGLKTGSLQNLRAELGVGASHKVGENTLVFGELSFIGDIVRNNPTAATGDERTHGTNPGRVGLNLSVGAAHQLTEDWSLNASYSLELMENSTSHSLNVGASYSF